MFKKKPPAINIGSSLRNSLHNANNYASFPNPTSEALVKPTAIERAGDALGDLIWKSAPKAHRIINGVVNNFAGTVDTEEDNSEAVFDQSHPDYWRYESYRGY